MARNTKGPTALPSELGQKIPVWNWRGAILAADIEPLTKLVCLAISHYLSDAGKGWRVSVKQLMADTGIKSNKTISTHLENAQKANLLVIQRTVKANGQRGVTLYKARFPDTVELSREPAEMPADDGECGSAEPSVTATPGAAAPSVPRTPRPRVPDTRQESFQQEGSFQKVSFQERVAQARPAPKTDAGVVDAEFDEMGHAEPAKPAKSKSQNLVALKAPTPAKARGHRLPEGWRPGGEGLRFAIECGLTEQQATIEFEKFQNYWLSAAGSKALKTDWDRTWKTWVRRASEALPRRAPTRSGGRVDRSQLCV
jgi:hypothetical protein